MATKRWIAAGIAVVAIALLGFGALSHDWLRDVTAGITSTHGLRAVTICQVVQPDPAVPGEESCVAVDHAAFAGAPSTPAGFGRWSAICTATFAVLLASAGLLLLTLVLTLTGTGSNLPVQPSSLAIVSTFATVALACLVLALSPYKGFETGPGFMMGSGGGAAGVLAAILLGRARPKVDDMW